MEYLLAEIPVCSSQTNLIDIMDMTATDKETRYIPLLVKNDDVKSGMEFKIKSFSKQSYSHQSTTHQIKKS